MSRATGTGLLVLGVILAVAGAIMRYAITVTTTGFDIATAGYILLWVGIVVSILAVIIIAVGSGSRTTSEEHIHRTPSGEVRESEQDEWSSV